MRRNTKMYLFLKIFVVIFFSYLSLLFLFPRSSLGQMAILFQSDVANSIFLVGSFLLIAFVLFEIFNMFVRIFRKRWRRRKFGKILVSEGYITEGELKAVLLEQRLRLGDVLYQAGRLNNKQLYQALEYQKRRPKKLGLILRELGHSTDEDINWALNRMKRRLGGILQERGLLKEIEIHRVLALQQYGLKRV